MYFQERTKVEEMNESGIVYLNHHKHFKIKIQTQQNNFKNDRSRFINELFIGRLLT
jgi:hypothetical protein